MRILFVSTMKNEGPYILEWLAYHRAIGFTDFLVYTNDCEDGSDLLLDRLAASGALVHERNEVLRRGPHKSALKYARQHPLFVQADWVFVGDADEFLNIRRGAGRVADLIAAYPDADAIPVTWRLFSHAGQVALTDGVLGRFTDAEPETLPAGAPARFVKTLFRAREDIERMGLHGPVPAEGTALRWRSAWLDADPAADPLRPAGPFGYDVAQVNHYAVRSVAAFLLKRDRGRANHVGDTLGIEYWKRWCVGGDEDTSILRHAGEVAAAIRDLAADPVVRALHAASHQWHADRVAALSGDPEVAALKADILALSGSAPLDAEMAGAAALAEAAPAEVALAVKAPKRHANRLAMLERMPKGGRVAEIGVWNGGFSAAILEVTRPSELILIDPWDLLAAQDAADWTHEKHQDAHEMGAMHDAVAARYADNPAVAIRKGFSAEVMETYPDGHFDWVYIDGNHLYDFVRRDIEIALDKVRPGGCIAGDDFFWKRDGRMHVREAVFDALAARGLDLKPERMGQQFMIWLPQ